MLTTPNTLDLLPLFAGSFWSQALEIVDDDGDPVDLTGYRARMDIARDAGHTRLVRLTTENGRIGIDDETGTIVLSIDADDSLSLPGMRWARYTLVLLPDGLETLAFAAWEGRIQIVPALTQTD